MDRLQAMKTFVTVVETGGFTAAARGRLGSLGWGRFFAITGMHVRDRRLDRRSK